MCYFRIIVLIAIVICSAMSGQAVAQSAQPNEPILVNGDNHESSLAFLDLLGQTAGKDKLIIMIARLGSRERARNLNWQRMKTAGSYLERVREVPKGKIVLAEGERVRDQGRIEIYLNGRLYMIILFARGKSFDRGG